MGRVNLNVSGKYTHTFVSGADLETSNITVSSESKIVANANFVSGKNISGTGSVYINALHETLDADLSKLTSDYVIATFSGDGTFIGNLGRAEVNVTDFWMILSTPIIMGTSQFRLTNATLSGDASLFDNLKVIDEHMSTVHITGLENTTTADLILRSNGMKYMELVVLILQVSYHLTVLFIWGGGNIIFLHFEILQTQLIDILSTPSIIITVWVLHLDMKILLE